MKRTLSILMCAILLACTLLFSVGCIKTSLNGVLTTEDGENQRIYTFYNNLAEAETNEHGERTIFNRLIVTEVINEVSYDMYFRFTIREENGAEYLDLKYEGIVYEGNDIYVAHMVNALDQNHKKSPNSTLPLTRTADYIMLDELKLINRT